ncbi:hypothetical protein [Streptomyces sp. NBC_00069]|uniref:hypothetical protein n=1 Tax=Streptomyces sp. NBC_00069 TaxID=2975639 RepID=UPI00386F8D58
MHPERLTAYSAVSTRLSLLSDHRLRALTAAATPLGSGIGGRSAELDVDGTRGRTPCAGGWRPSGGPRTA